MNTIHIRSWSDLRESFGINMLTGEACAFSMRVLCDVNEDGLALLSDYFGVGDLQLAAQMNSMVGDKPAIGGIMLHRNSLSQLAEFGLFAKNALGIATQADGTIIGLMDQKAFDAYANANYDIRRNYRVEQPGVTVGSRNVHQATGRVN